VARRDSFTGERLASAMVGGSHPVAAACGPLRRPRTVSQLSSGVVRTSRSAAPRRSQATPLACRGAAASARPAARMVRGLDTVVAHQATDAGYLSGVGVAVARADDSETL
jgi:hypothetical protein